MTADSDSESADFGKAIGIFFLIIFVIYHVYIGPWISDNTLLATAIIFLLLVSIIALLLAFHYWIPTLYYFFEEWWRRSRYHTGEPIKPIDQPVGSTADPRFTNESTHDDDLEQNHESDSKRPNQ